MNWQIQIIIFIPVWGLPLWFHRWAHRAAAGQSRLLGVETSQPCVDCWLHIGHHLTSSDMINWRTFEVIQWLSLSVCLYTVWEKKVTWVRVLVREWSCRIRFSQSFLDVHGGKFNKVCCWALDSCVHCLTLCLNDGRSYKTWTKWKITHILTLHSLRPDGQACLHGLWCAYCCWWSQVGISYGPSESEHSRSLYSSSQFL